MKDKYLNLYKDNIPKRISVLLIIVCITFVFYTIYLFSLQIIYGSTYQSKAKQVARRVTNIPSQRGEIYDRNYDVPLVMNIPSFAVEVTPAEIPPESIDSLFEELTKVLNISVEEINKKIPPKYYHLYQPIEIKSGISFNKIANIAENIEKYPGVTWHNKPIRSYLESGSISHVLGFVGDITTEDLQVLFNKGYNRNSTIGKDGIEKQYESILRGKDGKYYKTVDVSEKRINEDIFEEIPPEIGKNIVLTIDRNIQKLCEDALGDRMGSIVVLKPSSGEVLALVSYPWYDPNIFNEGRNTNEYKELSLDTRFPFLNRSIQSSYSPASVFKIIMTTAVIEEEAFPVDDTVNCKGQLTVGNRIFRCHKPEGHGRLNLAQGLAESCDVYFYTMGLKYLGIQIISEYAYRFGFGQLTGIDLPGEVPGLVPTPKWKERTYNTKWVGGDTVNTSIGQGFLTVTAMQMADMVAMVVNKGVIYKPHILKEIRNPISGKIIKRVEPTIINKSSIRKETFETVQEYMRGVITEGTAKVVITTKAVEVAGKTGTGEVGLEDRWNAWFAAYGPYNAENPDEQIVVVTMVEATNKWEWWAVRAANIVFQGIFANETYNEAIDSLNWGWLRNKENTE